VIFVVFDRAGFDWVSSHTLRKTVATWLDDAGLTARQIADHLGHARPSLTQDVCLGRKVVTSQGGQSARLLRLKSGRKVVVILSQKFPRPRIPGLPCAARESNPQPAD
jgi:hypothetical protein